MTHAPIAASDAPIVDIHAPVSERQGFHLVKPSPWPIIAGAFVFVTAIGLVMAMHNEAIAGVHPGPLVLALGVAGILFVMAGWWRDAVLEAQGGYHNAIVRHGLTIGMILFIASEVMFFVAWFWAFFWSSLFPGDPQVIGRLDFTGGLWPPKGTEVIDPLALPLMNTFVLVTSSVTANIAHEALRENYRQGFKNFLTLTIGLGVLFVATQAYEYVHAPFAFKNTIFGATFFMATGFHGAHVTIGVIFLSVCLARAWAGQFTPRQHIGFQFAAWYWHFVDVVWIFLFTCIYIWGSWGAQIEGAAG
jgi:cytochrome c oxidase subunit III